MASRMLQGRLVLSRIGFPARGFVQKSVCRAVSLADKKCVACEDAAGTLEICMAMDKAKATQMLEQVDGWTLVENDKSVLQIQRCYKSKNFVKGIELLERIGSVAEEEGHHPDIHLEGWNNVTVELSTHSRNGLTENDFIMAAKIDSVSKDDLLRKKKKS